MEKAIEQLEELNKKLDEIIDIMKRPSNKAVRILEIAGTVVTVVSVLSIIDIIRQWLGF